MTKAPIFGFNEHREEIVREVVSRVVAGTKDTLLVLNDAAYHETKRLESARGPKQVKERDEWLWCMERALSEHDLPDEVREFLMTKLRPLADHMRNRSE